MKTWLIAQFGLITIALLIIGLCFTCISHAEIDLNTAVGIWLFDDGQGDVAKDSSAAGNDGTLESSPEWIDGKFGKALKFNGRDNCVQTGQKLLDSLQEFTIVTWINTDSLVGSRIGLVGQNDSPEFGIDPIGRIFLWTPVSSVGHPYAHPDDEWHHVAAVADNEGLKVYVDGDVAAGGSAGNHGSSAFNVNIGGCGIWDATGNWFSGAMDEVAIFHSALNADDILEVMDGFGELLGGQAVEPGGKLTVMWGQIKLNR